MDLTPDADEVANALETVRQALGLSPSVAYGAHADEHSVAALAFQVLFLAVDRYSEVYSDDACARATAWVLDHHEMLPC